MSTRPPAPSPWPALAAVGLGASVGPLDFAVNVAFPAITEAFALSTHAIRWVAVCYVLTWGSLMLGFGALGDRIGHLRVFRAGLVLSALAFVLCALAPSYPWLLAARVVQGVAVALTLSCAPALATLLVDESRRTWALSAFAATAALATLAAPLLGGASVALMGWPGVYGIRLPIALIALALLPVVARRLRAPTRAPSARFDATGSALLASAVGLLMLGPALPTPGEWSLVAVPVSLAGALLMAVFVRRERRAQVPVLPPAVARDPDFRLINVASCVLQFASFSVPLVAPYLLLRALGWAPVAVGALLSAWAAGTLLGSTAAARVVAALGARRTAFAGALAATAGLGAIGAWPADPHPAAMAASLALQGIGIGLFQVAYSDLVVAALPVWSRGVAGSLTMVTRNLAVVLGATVWMWILHAVQHRALDEGLAAAPALAAGVTAVYRTAAAVAAGFVALTALRPATWFGRDRDDTT